MNAKLSKKLASDHGIEKIDVSKKKNPQLPKKVLTTNKDVAYNDIQKLFGCFLESKNTKNVYIAICHAFSAMQRLYSCNDQAKEYINRLYEDEESNW